MKVAYYYKVASESNEFWCKKGVVHIHMSTHCTNTPFSPYSSISHITSFSTASSEDVPIVIGGRGGVPEALVVAGDVTAEEVPGGRRMVRDMIP